MNTKEYKEQIKFGKLLYIISIIYYLFGMISLEFIIIAIEDKTIVLILLLITAITFISGVIFNKIGSNYIKWLNQQYYNSKVNEELKDIQGL